MEDLTILERELHWTKLSDVTEEMAVLMGRIISRIENDALWVIASGSYLVQVLVK